ncbi:polysaccharide pyruvyl transferase family protein [Clostridium baratii]|uniref:polysaccharide pyruvyl transferase family protein n=1 Tax=Clostridium baratii TaxID=1561 RepID=UPI001C024378|nr:polysaccharide pyruvyl transferase family protein [Clostridium baratii]MBT9830470.1 hypothetical protein [Clostridium baratii]MDY3207553.1 polysaccharide pyruvyl transferase family protein [Clostridium baratii]
MKKIGVLTFHRTTNYGAIYQTYALQKYLNENCICEVIDYNNNTLVERYELNPFKAKTIKQFLKRIIYYRDNKKLVEEFKRFTKGYIKLSTEKYNEQNITEADKVYDLFIAGSDQIWNLELSGYDLNYFSMFSKTKNKRNSYAASLGTSSLSEDKINIIKEVIPEQNFISIRESQGVDILKTLEMNCLKINQNIDPVFLLSKKEWEKLMFNSKKNERYIMVYEVAYTNHLRDFAEKKAKEYNLKLYFFSASNKKMKNAKNISDASPEKFLEYIHDADYVISSSFHGIALSIIFEKNFYYDIPNEKNSFSSRITSLVSLLGLEDRSIQVNSNKKINYDNVKRIVEKEKEKSKKYLNKIIEIGCE